MMKRILFVLAAVPAPAHAEFFCAPLATLSHEVNYCDENPAYVKPAQECRDRFKLKVKAKNEEIERAFASLVKKGGDAQAGDLEKTQGVLGTAEATLTELLVQGRASLAEVDAYAEDLVLPIYEGFEEDFDIDVHSAEGQKIFREKECYGEPMEDLDVVKTELRAMIKNLEDTKAKAVALHKATDVKHGGLENLGSMARGTTAKGSQERVPSAARKQKGSTITGVEEDKAKSK